MAYARNGITLRKRRSEIGDSARIVVAGFAWVNHQMADYFIGGHVIIMNLHHLDS
jgi:hypothetical protein